MRVKLEGYEVSAKKNRVGIITTYPKFSNRQGGVNPSRLVPIGVHIRSFF